MPLTGLNVKGAMSYTQEDGLRVGSGTGELGILGDPAPSLP